MDVIDPQLFQYFTQLPYSRWTHKFYSTNGELYGISPYDNDKINRYYPKDPCMVYLPTFGWFLW